MGILIQAGPKFLGTPLSAVARVDITLIAPTTTISGQVPTATQGAELVLFMFQDATGGRVPTWDAAKFKIVTNSGWQIDGTPSSVTVFRFTGSSAGFWWLSATPITGQTP
jgi:hypothetical protein